jgi:DnaJ-class molecular chaperone
MRREEIEVGLGQEPAPGPYVVMTAWHCSTCDVQGQTVAGAEVACWHCDGEVTVTARPSLRIDDL